MIQTTSMNFYVFSPLYKIQARFWGETLTEKGLESLFSLGHSFDETASPFSRHQDATEQNILDISAASPSPLFSPKKSHSHPIHDFR